MIVRAERPRESFTVISNTVINNHRLTLRARGLLIWILSKPDHWTVTNAGIAQQMPEGREAIRTAMAELEQAGYVQRRRRQDERGRWSTATVVFDNPCDRPVGNVGTTDTTGAQETVFGNLGAISKNPVAKTEPPVMPANLSGATNALCTTCNGGGWLHYCGEVEPCPECAAP